MALTFVLLTPEGEAKRLECDSVTLEARDNDMGEGGGSFGIRRGHLPLIAALKPGSEAKISSGGRVIASLKISDGFASVKNDTVTVICGRAEDIGP
ncbi:MAG: F0F1 ATP synthase subunit epsilon [Clostridia bacterium]|nr:F0F1 ATP synthase subunit epsilon [Clostridia bacterium]